MKKFSKLLACFLAVGMIFTGCGAPKEDAKKENTKNNIEQKEENKEESSAYPLTVKDSLGTEMTFDKKPEKILSMTLGTDEMLLDLVDKSRITALSGSIIEDEGISNIADRVEGFKKSEGNIELVISMNPELVFAADWTAKEKIQQLRDSGIKVYCYSTAGSVEQEKQVLRDIAKVVGEEENGEKLVAEMETVISSVKEKLGDIKEEDKVRVLFYNSWGTTNAEGTTFDDMVKLAGGINIPSEQGLKAWPEVSKEKIIEWNPDVIIVPSWSFDKKEDPKELANSILNDESFSSVKAVKEKKVIMLPDNHLNSVSQYMVYAVEDIAKAIYPDKFK